METNTFTTDDSDIGIFMKKALDNEITAKELSVKATEILHSAFSDGSGGRSTDLDFLAKYSTISEMTAADDMDSAEIEKVYNECTKAGFRTAQF